MERKTSWVLRGAMATMLIASAGSATATSHCPMCYTTASKAARSTVHALRSGTLMLAIPPLLLFSGMLALARRWNDEPGGHGETHSDEGHS